MAAASAEEGTYQRKEKLVGHKNFTRVNPRTDRFDAKKFHHVEFYCGDANSTYRRFAAGLGMEVVAKSDNSTGNASYSSYVLQSRDIRFVFTAPYRVSNPSKDNEPHPNFSAEEAHAFFAKHGLGIRAVAILVDDASAAYHAAVANGAEGRLEPTELKPIHADEPSQGTTTISEILLYGDAVLRFVSGDYTGPFLPGYQPVECAEKRCYGLERLDHIVGNVSDMLETYNYLARATGFHEFAEFTSEDVGTVDSGLNSIVAASNNEMVLLPINEPTFGTKRKSQIQTYLEQNAGPGVQHMALKTDDIFHTLRHIREMSTLVGFELMPRPSEQYYRDLPAKIGDDLSDSEYKQVHELGILVDKDDQGVLLQVFTKPVGDRPTLFLEIIQRVGCLRERKDAHQKVVEVVQAAGCGGFGKGNFKELFKSVEEYESTLGV